MAVTPEELRRVARLAHLELADDEIAPLCHDLGAILDYVARLDELVDDGDIVKADDGGPAQPRRPDEPAPCLPRDAALGLAADHDDEHFSVPKVV